MKLKGGFYERRFDYQIARGKYGSDTKAMEAARGIISACKEIMPYYRPRLQAIAMQGQVEHTCVIRAREIETDGPAWLAKYGPKDNVPALPNPVVDQIVNAVAEQESRLQQEYEQRNAMHRCSSGTGRVHRPKSGKLPSER